MIRYDAGKITNFAEDAELVLERGMRSPLNVVCTLVADHITSQEAVDGCATSVARHLPRIRRLSLKTHGHAFSTVMPWINSIDGLKHLGLVPHWNVPPTGEWQVLTLPGLALPSYSLVSFAVYKTPQCPLAASPRVLGDLTLLAGLCTTCTGDSQTVMHGIGMS